MAQMLHDIETARLIKSVDRNYNIIDSLKKEAKAQGVEDWRELIPGVTLHGSLDKATLFT